MMQRALVRATTLRSMVSELMNLTAMETGNFEIRRSPLGVDEVVAQAVGLSKEKAAEKGIVLCLNTAGGTKQVLADRKAMLIVFTNLIDNAIKYTPEGGHVGVRVEHNGLYAKVAVTDDGIGMTDEQIERAFEEFFRAKNEYTARVPGTGLGLTLVKRLVEMHQGRVNVKSNPGGGSAFTVELPVLGDARGN